MAYGNGRATTSRGSGMRNRGSRGSRVRTTSRALGAGARRMNTSGARGRITAQMNAFQRSSPATSRRAASRSMNRRLNRGGASGRPSFIEPGFTNKLSKRLPDGSLETYYCKGHTITSDGCRKVQNNLNANRNYIAQPGTGFGAKSPGTRGARRQVRR